MESVLKLPIGIRQLPQFRTIANVLGSEGKALLALYILFEELAYLAQDGGAAGRLPGSHRPMLLESLRPLFTTPDDPGKFFDETLVGSTKLLRPDGDDFVCPRFSTLNGQIGKPAREKVGGDMKAFYGRQRAMNEAGQPMQQTLGIASEKFVDAEGQALDPDTIDRVTRLIVCVDNALFRPNRPPFAFSEALIQSALKVARALTDEEINRIAVLMAKNRAHAFLSGQPTEKLLPLLGSLEGTLTNGAREET